MKNKETLKEVKDLVYYRANAEEDYLAVPISVLRYISLLEQEIEKRYSEEEVLQLIQFLAENEDFKDYSAMSIFTAEDFLNQYKNK